jgi:hypothetical protein
MVGVFKESTVLPHSKLARVDDDLLTVTGNLPMPMGEFPRRTRATGSRSSTAVHRQRSRS